MHRRARAALITVGVLLLTVTTVALVGLPVYVFPASEPVEDADLVYVLGPPRPQRIALERVLRKEGTADRSLISTSLVGGFTAERMSVCKKPDVECIHPEPYTTKGEVALLQQYANEHDIDRTIVITVTAHVARTRFILDKCFDGDAVVVGVRQDLDLFDWVGQYIYQTAAFVKDWVTPCDDQSNF